MEELIALLWLFTLMLLAGIGLAIVEVADSVKNLTKEIKCK